MTERADEPDVERAAGLARSAALRLLTGRARTRSELVQALTGKGYPLDVVHPVLDRLESVGLIDDDSYAQNWVEVRSQQGRGPTALRSELLRKGVDRAVIDEALRAVNPESERQAALVLCRRRAAGMSRLEPSVRRRRLLSLLARRGYPEALARDVVGDVVAESEP